MNKIDFVIPWVDGNDEKWRAEKNKFSTEIINNISTDNRYRDWNLLQYWFRGVEKFAPWVHKVYFITYGHVPAWLNIHHEKLAIINHKDYIPEEYLPTFSSHPIELNINKIAGLSECFVYFNDDMFLIRPMKEKDFFRKGLPVDSSIETTLTCIFMDDVFQYILLNDVSIINKHFDKRKVIRDNTRKWFSLKYRRGVLNNLLLAPWKNFSSFKLFHLPQPFLKSVLDEVWEEEGELLDAVCCNKFRTYKDVNQYLFRYWQLCKGLYYPKKICGVAKPLGYDDDNMARIIKEGNYQMICLNDPAMDGGDIDINKTQEKMTKAFECILGEKSSFEI